jgi:L-lactate dehydrogenase (cytochrome)
VSHRDLTTTVLGENINLPVILAPAGLQRLVSREGELAAVKAAAEAGTIFVASTTSSFSIEEIASVTNGPLWFQLYLSHDRDICSLLIQRAYEAKYSALCLTVDTQVVGKRERDLRCGMTIPPHIGFKNLLLNSCRLTWVRDFLLGQKITFRNLVDLAETDDVKALATLLKNTILNPAATWDDLIWLRQVWDRPIIIKGIMSADDAVRAVDHGADGILVSNHGGRQLESSPSTLDALPEVVEAVGDQAEIFLDGGIRRGRDVVKAKALGARACLIGRPYLWGLAVGGQAGVAHILEVFRDEIDRTLALIGQPKFSEVEHSAVRLRCS